MKSKFLSPDLDLKSLNEYMENYTEKAREGSAAANAYPDNHISPYQMSKMGVILMTFILAKQLQQKDKDNHILVNACCPGICKTDLLKEMHLPAGVVNSSAQDGSATPLYLAMLPQGLEEPNGKFITEKKDATQRFVAGENPLMIFKDLQGAHKFI